MSWNLPVGLWSYDLVETIWNTVMEIFGTYSEKYCDYALRVVLPEIMLKIVMDKLNVTHEEADLYIFKAWNSKESNQVNDACGQLTRKITLTQDDMKTLDDKQWLNCNVINAAQQLLRKAHPDANGLLDTLYVTDKKVTTQPGRPFVQIFYDSCHWLTASNIGCKLDTIRLYCSLRQMPSENCRQQLLHFAALNVTSVELHVVAVVKQSNGSGNCGVFALAYAQLLLAGEDPSRVVLHENELRGHLRQCLKRGAMTPFPIHAMQVPKNDIVRRMSVAIYCVCRASCVKNSSMIQCGTCNEWLHVECIKLSQGDFMKYREDKSKVFVCVKCT